MIPPDTVRQLAQSPEKQCLTLYFNTGPNDQRSAWLTRFKNLVRRIDPTVPSQDRRAFAAAVARVENFLKQYQPQGNSFLAYATRNSWQQFVSRVPVRDELHWGRPDVSQLLWLLEEYRPYGVLIVDRQHVRFLAVRMNEFEEYREFSIEIDTNDWRKPTIAAGGSGRGKPRGRADTNAFNARYMERLQAFWRSIQKPLAELLDRYHVKRLVLAGNKSLLPEFARSLNPSLAAAVITQVPLETFSSPADAVKRIYPKIVEWETDRQARIVTELLDAASISNKAAVGVEPVVKLIQEGRAARLLIARDFERTMSECRKCNYVAPADGRTCPRCSADELNKSALTAALPRLVLNYNVPVEVIKGPPGEELARNGGLGAFLRF